MWGTSLGDYLFRLVEDIGEMALATVLAVVHSSHEDTSTTLHHT